MCYFSATTVGNSKLKKLYLPSKKALTTETWYPCSVWYGEYQIMELLIFQEDCLKCAIHASWVFDTRVFFLSETCFSDNWRNQVCYTQQLSHCNALDLFHVIVFDLTMVLMRPFFVISTYFFIITVGDLVPSQVWDRSRPTFRFECSKLV